MNTRVVGRIDLLIITCIFGGMISACEAWAGEGCDTIATGSGGEVSQRSPARQEGDAAEKYIYNDATLKLRDGQTIRGLFAGVSSDSIAIWQPGRTRWFGVDQAQALRVEANTNPAFGTLYGAIVGGCLGLVLESARGSSMGYRETRQLGFVDASDSGPWFWAGAGIVIGGTFGYLVTASGGSAVNLDFQEDALANRRELDLLRGLETPDGSPTIHLRLSAGWLSFRTKSPTNEHVGVYGLWGGERGNFTRFRRALLTYSIVPWVDVGVAVVNFSEPSLVNSGMRFSSSVWCEQSSRNTLYCLMGLFRPLSRVLPSGISWDVGGGLGIAAIDYRSSILSQGYYGFVPDSAFSVETINSSSVGITLFTGLTFYPDESLSLGFTVDYTVAPAIQVGAEPVLGLESRRLGNACLGVEVGFHF